MTRASIRSSVVACLGVIATLPSTAADDGSLFGYEQYGAGHQVAYMIGAAAAQSDAKASGVKQIPVPGSDGKVEATVAMGRQDGKPVGSIETKVPVNFLLMEAGSRATLVGDVCPAADGSVAFTVRLESGAAGGTGPGSYGTTLEARVTASVGDDAEIANAEYEVNQALRPAAGGPPVESRARASAPGGKFAGGRVTLTDGQWVTRPSRAADETPASLNLLRAVMLGYGALHGARDHWQGGGCIKINAPSPGRVAPNATSKIPVEVTHRQDGSRVAARVTVALAGGKSASPSVIPKAPGEVTHVAPGQNKARMTITLAATSRRGKDKLDLKLDTGGPAFHAEGGLQDFHGTGLICDLSKTFTISGGGNVVTFEPTSDRGGNYHYAGTMQGFGVFGHGTYVVNYNGDTPVGIVGNGVGSVRTPIGVVSNSASEKYKLTPRAGC